MSKKKGRSKRVVYAPGARPVDRPADNPTDKAAAPPIAVGTATTQPAAPPSPVTGGDTAPARSATTGSLPPAPVTRRENSAASPTDEGAAGPATGGAVPPINGDRARYLVEAELVVETPLHVGSGEVKRYDFMKPNDNKPGLDDRWPYVARLARDGEQQTYLPGSTIKGLIRRVVEDRIGQKAVTGLCGAVKINPDEDQDGAISDSSQPRGAAPAADPGAMGALLVRGARLIKPGEAGHWPWVERAERDPHNELPAGVYIAARTAIDPGTGTASHNKLFFQEMIAPGARFQVRLVLEARRRRPGRKDKRQRSTPDESDADFEERVGRLRLWLAQTLACLGDESWSIGKGQADGHGLVRLRVTRSTAMTIDPDTGSVEETRFTLSAKAPPAPYQPRRWTLGLTCEGPFMVADSSHEPTPEGAERNNLPMDDPGRAQLRAQRQAANRPLLPATSVMGALKARAAWLEKLKAHSEGKPPPASVIDIVRSRKDIERLTPLQRLFGVTGFRGLLSLRGLELQDARRWNVSSVKLDRFSGAPFDQALFTSAVFVGVNATATLELGRRTAEDGDSVTPDDRDDALMTRLRDDLRENGLMLGHATNRGFGWFTCTATEEPRDL